MTTLGIARMTLLSAALLVAATGAQAASYNISNDYTGWLNSVQAIGPTTLGTGTFACGQVGIPSNVACGTVVLNGLPGVGFAQNGPGSTSYGGPSTGLINNLGVAAGNPPTLGYLEWTLPTPQNGWGGTFRMTTGNGLQFQVLDAAEGNENLGWIDVTGASIDSTQSLNGFLGFSSTERFSGVRVITFSNPTGSSYTMSDVSIARATPTAVPEPGSLALLALAGSALAFTRRRRQA